MSITPDPNDFVTPITPPGCWTKLVGLARGLIISGEGQVEWCFLDTEGGIRTIRLPAYLVKKSPVRLLACSRKFFDDHECESITLNKQGLRLNGLEGDPTRSAIDVPWNSKNNLPISVCNRPSGIKEAGQTLNATVASVHKENFNLSDPEKELLRWHHRFGHLAFNKIKFLLSLGLLATASWAGLHRTASKLRTVPKCAACQFGKQTIRPAPGITNSIVKDRQGVISAEQLFPGQQVSVDHFVCSTLGCTFESKGHGPVQSRYKGGCIFVDSASNNVFIYLQRLLTTHETLEAKKAFEDYCASEGVIPQTYLSDNGAAFTSQQYTEELSKFSQISKFAGVGAHHHNAKAERAIRTIMSIARTMMLHAAIHWPDTADPALWPMAVKHAEYLFNHIPDPSTGLSPHDIFTRTRWPLKKLHDLHVFGCPAYVLDKTIQDGKKIPRWKPRSDRRIYVGVSHSHASTVGLCLNLTTGAITPQYHVVYDDEFATVSSTPEDLSMLTAPEWIKLFGDSAYQYVQDTDEVDPPLDPTLDSVLAHHDKVSTALDRHRQPAELPRYHPPGPVTTAQQPQPMLEPATSASTPSQPQTKNPPRYC